MRTLSTYCHILKSKGLYICFQELKKALCPIWFTRNRAAIEHIQSERAERYLWRRYKDIIMRPLASQAHESQPKTIWLCWLQGKEQAPDIVKKCIVSIEHYAPDYTIHLLTAETLFNYVSLPDHIIRRYREGTIPFAHFSDVLRTALIVQHGGIWLDATVLLTGKLPEYISQSSLFMYQVSVLQHLPHATSNWLIAGQKGHPLLQRQLELLYAYWGKERGLRDYFIFHILFYLLVTHNAEAQALFAQMPYVANADVHLMQKRFDYPYTEHLWTDITRNSAVHKLSWKHKTPHTNNQQPTLYDYIVHHLHV